MEQISDVAWDRRTIHQLSRFVRSFPGIYFTFDFDHQWVSRERSFVDCDGRVSEATSRSSSRKRDFCFSRHLFLGNLCHVKIDEVRRYCEQFGPVLDLILNRDKEGNVNVRAMERSARERQKSLLGLSLFRFSHLSIVEGLDAVHEQTSSSDRRRGDLRQTSSVPCECLDPGTIGRDQSTAPDRCSQVRTTENSPVFPELRPNQKVRLFQRSDRLWSKRSSQFVRSARTVLGLRSGGLRASRSASFHRRERNLRHEKDPHRSRDRLDSNSFFPSWSATAAECLGRACRCRCAEEVRISPQRVRRVQVGQRERIAKSPRGIGTNERRLSRRHSDQTG